MHVLSAIIGDVKMLHVKYIVFKLLKIKKNRDFFLHYLESLVCF